MAVTTGKDTGTTSTGGGSGSKSPDSGRGSGGPGGGSLSAPNRTDPSKGATASKAAPSSASGKTDKETPAPTSAPGKTDKVGTSEGPAKKPGLAGLQGASTQAKFDKQKDLYTQAGGASVSMRNPSGQKESAKVVDPSRGPNRGLDGINTTSTKTAAGKTDKEPGPSVARPTNGGIVSRGSGTSTGWGGQPKAPTSAPGKTDKEQTAPSYNVNKSFSENWFKGTVTGKVLDTLSGGRLSKATESLPGEYKRSASGTSTPWGNSSPTPQTVAPGKANPQQSVAPGKGNPQQSVAAGKTDKLQTPSVARPTQESFIDSLVNSGPSPAGALTVGGSILGMQPTAPSLGQVIARDPISYGGPRAGTTPAQPSTPVDVNANPVGEGIQQQMIAERVLNAMKQAAMADPRPPGRTRGVGDFFNQSPAPTSNLLDKGNLEQSVAPGKVSMPGATMPSMPDPRLAAMQEQFERMKAARGQIAGAVPASAPAPTTVPGKVSMPTPQAPAPGKVALPGPAPTSVPGKVSMPTPQTVAPGRTDLPAAPDVAVPTPPRSINDILQEIALAEAAVNGLGIEAPAAPFGEPALADPTPPAADPMEVDINGYPQSVSPSQEGSYPPDENFMQDAGQPDDLGQLDNRYEYEKERAWEGLKALPERLWNAITSGDIRGFTPETNDKRAEIPPSERQKKNPAPRMDQSEAVAVARLLALVKLLEQQGTSQQQADLVNSTFI